MPTYLEFEKPVAELEAKIAELSALTTVDSDYSEAIKVLRANSVALRKDIASKITRWQRVQLSRHPDRPYTLDYIEKMCEEFIELHGDRTVRDDPAMVAGFGNIGGQSVMIIGQQKGRNT